MGWRLTLLNTCLGAIEKPALTRADPLEARRRFERQGRLFRPPPFSLFQDDQLGGVAATWASCRATRPEIILYFHGGGYFMGSPFTHRAMLARISHLSGLRACLPDYCKAPEHVFPAALEDAKIAWNTLISRGYPAHKIILGGDSAGGGLMLALLAKLLSNGEKPAAAFAFSPWTDLTLSGESITQNARSERILPASRLQETCDGYADVTAPDDPGISPLFADFTGAPPIFLQCASTELLRDDTLRLAKNLNSAGVDVTLEQCGNLPHVWQIFQGHLPEADAALSRTADFIRQQVPSAPPTGN